MTRNPDPILAEQYRTMTMDLGSACWRCGRTAFFSDKPDWWAVPWLGAERAHVVSKPRVEQREACVLLCSLCHKIQHGYHFPQLPDARPLTLAELLGVKKANDLLFYDREFLKNHSITRLPKARVLTREQLTLGLGRSQ